MNKRIISLIIAIICLFALVGCQNMGEAPVFGDYLGENIDECYEAWGITPEKDISLTTGDIHKTIHLKDPVNYLGEEFSVRLTYPTGSRQLEFLRDKLDSVKYVRDYYNVTEEEMAKEAVTLFERMREEYEPYGEAVSIRQMEDLTIKIIDESVLTEEGLTETLKTLRRRIDEFRIDEYYIMWDWELPEKYKNIDQDYIKDFEEHNGQEYTYGARCSLEYRDGHYAFTVWHSISGVYQ